MVAASSSVRTTPIASKTKTRASLRSRFLLQDMISIEPEQTASAYAKSSTMENGNTKSATP